MALIVARRVSGEGGERNDVEDLPVISDLTLITLR